MLSCNINKYSGGRTYLYISCAATTKDFKNCFGQIIQIFSPLQNIKKLNSALRLKYFFTKLYRIVFN